MQPTPSSLLWQADAIRQTDAFLTLLSAGVEDATTLTDLAHRRLRLQHPSLSHPIVAEFQQNTPAAAQLRFAWLITAPEEAENLSQKIVVLRLDTAASLAANWNDAFAWLGQWLERCHNLPITDTAFPAAVRPSGAPTLPPEHRPSSVKIA